MIRRAWAWLVDAPPILATPADTRTISLVGLELPRRATAAVSVITLAVLVDYTRTFLPDDVGAEARTPGGLLAVAVVRGVLLGLIPLVVVLLGFRDRPSRYGLQLGDIRAGSVLTGLGLVVMTPIVLWFATLPDARAFYAPGGATSLGQIVLTNAIDLTAAEFAFRGFLLFALVRAIGPFGVVVATLPFIYAHLGKPELELLSTLGGGMVYGWLAWRTGSIVWGTIGHIVILSMVTIAAAAPG